MSILRILFLQFVVSVAFAQQSSVTTQSTDFETVTKARLQAAAGEMRQDWDKNVSPVAIVTAESGARDNREQFWQDEVHSCKDAHCTATDFNTKIQSNIVQVNYSLIVASNGAEKLVRCIDTYIVSEAMWKLISGIRSAIPNARKPRADVDTATLQKYAGKYSDQSGQVYEVSLIGDRLSVRHAGEPTTTELIPESPTRFYVIGDDSSTEFVKSKRGDVTGVVIHMTSGDKTLTRTI